MLRSENQEERRGPPAYNVRRARRISVSCSPASAPDTTDENSTDLGESSPNIQGRSNGWEGWIPDGGVANPMELVIDHTDLPTILEESQVPEGMPSTAAVDGICAGHDFEAMLALVADMGDTELFPPLDSAAEIDDLLFVPQPNSHLGALLSFPSSPPPELETDWLAGNCSDFPLFPPFLESTQQVDQLGASSEQTGEVFELITNTSCTPLSAAASPPSSLNPGALIPANLQSEMQAIETAMERGDTSGILTANISDQFRCAFGVFDGSFVRTLLEQLTQSDRVVGEEVIIYFASKLTALHTASETWIGRRTSLYELSNSRRRLLIMLWGNNEWSLIEVQPHIGRLTHYKCSQAGSMVSQSMEHSTCSDCITTAEHVNGLLRREGKLVPSWEYTAQNIPTELGDGALWLIWVTRLRAERASPTEPVPAGYRLTLAREFLHDFKAMQSSDSILKAGRPSNTPTQHEMSTVIEDFWTQFGNENGFGRKLWDTVQQFSARVNAKSLEPVGLERASELVQLAVSIGSPDVLLALKDCLRQVRSQLLSANASYPDTPWGTFDALRGHQRKEHLSIIGVRLGNWKLQQLKRDLEGGIDDIVDHILSGKPPSASASRKEIAERLKDKKASYWCHIVDYVGNKDPNILCLLPRTVTIGPPRWPRKFNATSYRDLPVWECKLLGELCADLRPQVLLSVDADLSKDLFYMRDPAGQYRIETLSEEQIEEQKLNSDFLVGILKKIPTD